MNDLMKLAEELSKFSQNKVLFLKTEPEIGDFTQPFPGKLLVYGDRQYLTINIQDKNELSNIYHQLSQFIFCEGVTLICWNVKNLISYFKFMLPRTPIQVGAKVVDLKLIEGFLGVKQTAPSSLVEALRRLGPYTTNDECKLIHKEIHRPLALRVVPDMETCNLVIDTESKKYAYSSYDIEGQTFGRLQSYETFKQCVTPHNMGDERKAQLKLRNEKDFFVAFDFKHMEVTMLQWLTGDPLLKKIIDDREDVYRGIYRTIVGSECDTADKRDLIKNIFLPVMFGMMPNGMVKGLAKRGVEITPQSAQTMHRLIKEKFSTAYDFLSDYQERVKTTPVIKDKFGRPRDFSENPLSVRGFLVQSPSAVFCLEKLIELHDAVGGLGKLLYSIHDGYVLVANEEKLNRIVVTGLKTLQSPSKLCSGLSLKVSCSLGVRLSHMKELPSKEKNAHS